MDVAHDVAGTVGAKHRRSGRRTTSQEQWDGLALGERACFLWRHGGMDWLVKSGTSRREWVLVLG